MNQLSMTIAISICAASVLLILMLQAPNVAKAYSCTSSSSIHAGGASSSVSGNSGSCATGASSSSSAKGFGVGFFNPFPPNHSDNAFLDTPGAADTFSGGGSKSSCLAISANHASVGNVRGSFPQQGSCSSHSP